MTDKELKEIREKISCPQFGDGAYGEWGILNLKQRKTILKMLDYIKQVKTESVIDFAERLKENAYPDDSICTQMVVAVEDIDNLVKEKVGDNDAE